mgnify:CR=1 FL=1
MKKGRVSLNGAVIKKGETKCTESDSITVDGKDVGNSEFVYIMMNKPKGVISASDGKGDKTVVDILPEDMKRRGLFPAGRLDKDTTGFVLITDDGEFAHNILSPAHHIDKTYIVTLDKPVTEEVKSDFESGMTLNDEKLLRAELSILNEDRTVAKVVLHQGLYHQIKRMLQKTRTDCYGAASRGDGFAHFRQRFSVGTVQIYKFRTKKENSGKVSVYIIG